MTEPLDPHISAAGETQPPTIVCSLTSATPEPEILQPLDNLIYTLRYRYEASRSNIPQARTDD
ncbi:hypothetical protein [Nocardia nova]|uniref:hypothetical protein n=1 Tax=Nocardia nova TaxID=37330 RepID=UPI0007A4B411|nr:hypothetical protein [Nocardia nova]